jgi:hypothetical protein
MCNNVWWGAQWNSNDSVSVPVSRQQVREDETSRPDCRSVYLGLLRGIAQLTVLPALSSPKNRIFAFLLTEEMRGDAKQTKSVSMRLQTCSLPCSRLQHTSARLQSWQLSLSRAPFACIVTLTQTQVGESVVHPAPDGREEIHAAWLADL